MYALIYDEHDLVKPKKKVISVHKSRDTAETALEKRKKKLGKKVWECNTRIVWTTWRPGEPIPAGEMYSDTD
jgi:hypothetical protein